MSRGADHASAKPRPCPVCTGVGARKTVFRPKFQEGLLGDSYEVVVCKECGAGFADGIPGQDELDRFYSEESKYGREGPAGSESPYDIARFEGIVDQVEAHLPSRGARILDIGCATGGLLSVFKRRGFANVLGMDPSPACASAAARLHGVQVKVATLGKPTGIEGRFDLVLLVGVLEHVRDAADAVRAATALLESGGLLYAAVPDVEGLADSRNAPFQQFSMEHVNFFSRQSLSRLLAGSGFAQRQLWQYTTEWREGVTEPVVGGLFQSGQSGPPSPDTVTGPALENYVHVSLAREKAIFARVDELVQGGEPLLVWGAGAFTRRLLATTALSKANIAGFVDSNPHLQGKQLSGRPVLAPGAVAGRSEAIVIGSVAFEREIVDLIQKQLRLGNRIVSLTS
jgi:SAM-dependent methyltransferase